MDSLFQSSKYGDIKKADTTTNRLYVIKFISEAYTIHNNTTMDGQIIYAGEFFVKAQYICSMKENPKCYWKQQSLQHHIIV